MNSCQFDGVTDGRRCERRPAEPNKYSFNHGNTFFLFGLIRERQRRTHISKFIASCRPVRLLLLWRFLSIQCS
jgi:hypothetical protein